MGQMAPCVGIKEKERDGIINFFSKKGYINLD
jgi:hypothetical protein